MPLTDKDVEEAFVETAREQRNGEPFNWQRTAEILNLKLGERRERAAGPWTFAR
jgi:hypothetical protein